MVDVYCKVCGEPWDTLDIREKFTEKESDVRCQEDAGGKHEKENLLVYA